MTGVFKINFTLHLRKLTLRVETTCPSFLRRLAANLWSEPASSSSVPSVVHCWGFSALEQGKLRDVGLGSSGNPQNLASVHPADPPLQVKNQKQQQPCPGTQLVRTSSWYTKVVGSVSGQGTDKEQPTNAWMGGTNWYFLISSHFLSFSKTSLFLLEERDNTVCSSGADPWWLAKQKEIRLLLHTTALVHSPVC